MSNLSQGCLNGQREGKTFSDAKVPNLNLEVRPKQISNEPKHDNNQRKKDTRIIAAQENSSKIDVSTRTNVKPNMKTLAMSEVIQPNANTQKTPNDSLHSSDTAKTSTSGSFKHSPRVPLQDLSPRDLWNLAGSKVRNSATSKSTSPARTKALLSRLRQHGLKTLDQDVQAKLLAVPKLSDERKASSGQSSKTKPDEITSHPLVSPRQLDEQILHRTSIAKTMTTTTIPTTTTTQSTSAQISQRSASEIVPAVPSYRRPEKSVLQIPKPRKGCPQDPANLEQEKNKTQEKSETQGNEKQRNEKPKSAAHKSVSKHTPVVPPLPLCLSKSGEEVLSKKSKIEKEPMKLAVVEDKAAMPQNGEICLSTDQNAGCVGELQDYLQKNLHLLNLLSQVHLDRKPSAIGSQTDRPVSTVTKTDPAFKRSLLAWSRAASPCPSTNHGPGISSTGISERLNIKPSRDASWHLAIPSLVSGGAKTTASTSQTLDLAVPKEDKVELSNEFLVEMLSHLSSVGELIKSLEKKNVDKSAKSDVEGVQKSQQRKQEDLSWMVRVALEKRVRSIKSYLSFKKNLEDALSRISNLPSASRSCSPPKNSRHRPSQQLFPSNIASLVNTPSPQSGGCPSGIPNTSSCEPEERSSSTSAGSVRLATKQSRACLAMERSQAHAGVQTSPPKKKKLFDDEDDFQARLFETPRKEIMLGGKNKRETRKSDAKGAKRALREGGCRPNETGELRERRNDVGVKTRPLFSSPLSLEKLCEANQERNVLACVAESRDYTKVANPLFSENGSTTVCKSSGGLRTRTVAGLAGTPCQGEVACPGEAHLEADLSPFEDRTRSCGTCPPTMRKVKEPDACEAENENVSVIWHQLVDLAEQMKNGITSTLSKDNTFSPMSSSKKNESQSIELRSVPASSMKSGDITSDHGVVLNRSRHGDLSRRRKTGIVSDGNVARAATILRMKERTASSHNVASVCKLPSQQQSKPDFDSVDLTFWEAVMHTLGMTGSR